MQRTILTAIAAFAATALIAPAALAERPDDRAGLLGVGAVVSTGQDVLRPDDRAGRLGVGSITAPPSEPSSTIRPDDRSGLRGPGANARVSATRPDDRPGFRGPGAFAPVSSTILVSDGGFAWGDAGIGVAGGLGLALLAAGLLTAALHRRRMRPVV